MKLYILIAYIAYLVIMSIITFLLFCKDKKIAESKGNKMRIKEKTLLGLVCFGGALGGELGRVAARHKTGKLYFSLIIFISIVLQYLTLICLIAFCLL